jgi:hypothetical protein
MTTRRSTRSSHLIAIAVLGATTVLVGCSNRNATTRPSITAATNRPAESVDTASPNPDSTNTDTASSPGIDLSKDYGDGITLATTCGDYLQHHDASTRYDAAIRMSVDFNVDDPGNPMWGPNMDSVCGSAPDMTFGGYFGRAGRR